MKLSEIKKQHKVKIKTISTNADARSKLTAMGFFIGAEIELLRETPRKNLKAYLISGNIISISTLLASKIEVE